VHEPSREQVDVEAQVRCMLVDHLFLRCQKIDQQSRQFCLVEHACDMAIAGAVPAAAAAVSEQHDRISAFRQGQIALKSDGVCGDLDQLLRKGPVCSVSHWMPPQFAFLPRVFSLEQVLNLFIRSL
jgi:hypothetical protein